MVVPTKTDDEVSEMQEVRLDVDIGVTSIRPFTRRETLAAMSDQFYFIPDGLGVRLFVRS